MSAHQDQQSHRKSDIQDINWCECATQDIFVRVSIRGIATRHRAETGSRQRVLSHIEIRGHASWMITR